MKSEKEKGCGELVVVNFIHEDEYVRRYVSHYLFDMLE